MQRRHFLFAVGGAAFAALSDLSIPAGLSAATKADFTLRTAPLNTEIAARQNDSDHCLQRHGARPPSAHERRQARACRRVQ